MFHECNFNLANVEVTEAEEALRGDEGAKMEADDDRSD